MRVLFVNPAAELGGAERSLLDCVFALRQTDPDGAIGLIAFADGPLVARARALGATVMVIEPPLALATLGESGQSDSHLRTWLRRIHGLPGVAIFLARLRRAIEDYAPDVLHTNGMKAHVFAGIIAPGGIGLVAHLRDFVGSRQASKHVLPLIAGLRDRVAFVANSQAVADDFLCLAPHASVRVVYNVVDTEYLRPGLPEPEWLSAAAGMNAPERQLIFGLVATYARWKGHGLFIEAAARLRTTFPNVPLRFYIVGGPIYQTAGSQVTASELTQHAEAAGVGDCLGLVPFQQDIARVYRSLDVVVNASTTPEPFGRTIVEAMACERAVIVANAGGSAELFTHGENALGFMPGSSESLAATMAETIDPEVRSGLGRSARAHALKNFGRGRLGPELLRAYQELPKRWQGRS